MRNVIGFHRPEEENGYLSNWYLANFTVDGIEYSSMDAMELLAKVWDNWWCLRRAKL